MARLSSDELPDLHTAQSNFLVNIKEQHKAQLQLQEQI